MKLLAPTTPSELPTEALLARLRGRRATVFGEGGAAPENATDWVCRRLNARLRRDLEPCLELLALRTLVVSLRYALAGEVPPEGLRRDRLLAAPLHRLARTGERGETLVARLEAALGDDYPCLVGLTEIHRQQGPGGVEQRLVSGLLRHGLDRARNTTVRWLLRTVADLRNGLAIIKHWQWQVPLPPDLTRGGFISVDLLLRIFAGGDRERLARLLGTPGATEHAAAMERALLASLTRRLRQAARDPLGLAIVLDYLWRAQLAAHDRALRRSPAVNREDLLTETLLL